MGGVFLVLSVGVAVSFFYTVLELLWEVGCTSLRENVSRQMYYISGTFEKYSLILLNERTICQVSFKEELMAELKFIIKCDNSPKPVRKRKGSSNRSGEDSTRGCTPPYGFIPAIKTSSTDDK